MTSKTPSTLNESLQAKMRKDEKREESQESLDMRSVMSAPEGRRVMYRVLEMCGCGVVNSDIATHDLDGMSDPHATFMEIGERQLGEKIKLDMLTLVPDLFTTMMGEEAARAAEEIKQAKLKNVTSESDEEDDDEVD